MGPGRRSPFPATGDSAPATSRSKVVLPPPFGPESAITSPWWPVRSTASRTGRPPNPAVTPASDHATAPPREGVERIAGGLYATGQDHLAEIGRAHV